MNAVWGYSHEAKSYTLETHISKLRSVLRNASSENLLHVVQRFVMLDSVTEKEISS